MGVRERLNDGESAKSDTQAMRLDKRAIAHSFSRAADRYDAAASLQQSVGLELMTWLESDGPCSTASHDPKVLMDLGSGTGFFLSRLKATLNANDQLIACDLALGMLQHSQTNESNTACAIGALHVCADAECLPLPNASVDRVFSNFSLQWCSDFSRLMVELSRVLKPGGELVLAIPGARTLFELKACWREVDPKHPHVNEFIEASDLRHAAEQAGLMMIQEKRQQYVQYFDSVRELMSSLKNIGAHNAHRDRQKTLTKRADIKRLIQNYERYRNHEGCLPATYDVLMFKLVSPA